MSDVIAFVHNNKYWDFLYISKILEIIRQFTYILKW